MHLSASSLVEAGIQDGQGLRNAATYVNYASFGTPVEAMYGENLGRLRKIKKKYDPDHVMGLAGGWENSTGSIDDTKRQWDRTLRTGGTYQSLTSYDLRHIRGLSQTATVIE